MRAPGRKAPCRAGRRVRWRNIVQRTRQPLLVASDVQGTARRLGLAPMNPRIKTWCGVPLHFSDGSMGVLALADMEREYAVTKIPV